MNTVLRRVLVPLAVGVASLGCTPPVPDDYDRQCDTDDDCVPVSFACNSCKCANDALNAQGAAEFNDDAARFGCFTDPGVLCDCREARAICSLGSCRLCEVDDVSRLPPCGET
jgi:hypothetical protein